MTLHDAPTTPFDGGPPDQIAETLRRMSRQASVTGHTVALVAYTGNVDQDVRMWAAETLRHAVNPIPEESAELAKLLSSTAYDVSYWAATMIGRLGRRNGNLTEVVDALVACIEQSPSLATRERAVAAISQIGPAAAPASRVLRSTTQSDSPRLRRLATEAVRRIGVAA